MPQSRHRVSGPADRHQSQETVITPQEAGTLPGLFWERVRRTPEQCAYRSFDTSDETWATITWRQAADHAERWQAALLREGYAAGDRVAVMLGNRPEWVWFDQAAQGLGLVTVPLFVKDRAENFAYILEQTRARLLVIEGLEHWNRIEELGNRLDTLDRIVTLEPVCDEDRESCDARVREAEQWLDVQPSEFEVAVDDPQGMATIVYTSGTTGRPKGVMLSHANILENGYAGLRQVAVYPDDLFLSFLPLSHTLERTVGYYIPMMAGACVAFVRSIKTLMEDLAAVRPTLLVTVPRLYERVYGTVRSRLDDLPMGLGRFYDLLLQAGWRRFLHRQGRASWTPLMVLAPLLDLLLGRRVKKGLGGRLRYTVSGGAALTTDIARFFLGMGVDVLQGYGLTETSPIISVNTPEDNRPQTVGRPLPGVEVRLGGDDELLTKGPHVMLGYWEDPEATDEALDKDGWLHSGDKAELDEDGFIRIVGRLKEILVLSNGEKVPPDDLQMAILLDSLFEQSLVVGEGRPFLVALLVLDPEAWKRQAARLGLDPDDPEALASDTALDMALGRVNAQLEDFPGYAKIKAVHLTLERWTVEEGLITPTLKARRRDIKEKFAEEIEAMYEKE